MTHRSSELGGDVRIGEIRRMLTSDEAASRPMCGSNPARKAYVFAPDNEVMGSVLARKVRRMARLRCEDHMSVSRFCQWPTPQRFSMIAHERANPFAVAGYCTVSWTLDLDGLCEIDPSEQDFRSLTLAVELEALFVDARLRRDGYARALWDGVSYWIQSLVRRIDRATARVHGEGSDGLSLTVVLVSDATATFPKRTSDLFCRLAKEAVEAIARDELIALGVVAFDVDITMSGGSVAL